jgi:hypothetical protein
MVAEALRQDLYLSTKKCQIMNGKYKAAKSSLPMEQMAIYLDLALILTITLLWLWAQEYVPKTHGCIVSLCF